MDDASPHAPAGAGSRLWRSAYLLLGFTAIFWAGNSVVARAARDLVPPATLSFWRWAIALILLLPFAWPRLRRDWRALRHRWAMIVVLGILGVGAFNTLLYSGLQHTTALNSLLMQAAQPGLILLLGVAMFRDSTNLAQIAGVVLATMGVVVIVARGDVATLLAFRLNRGDVLVVIGVLLWSLYSVLLRSRPKVHPISFLAATVIVGVVFILPFYIAELLAGARIVATPESALAIGYVAIFPSLLAYLCFNRGVELIGSAATGQFLNIMPVIGAGLAILFLGETLRLFHLGGMALIASGIWLSAARMGRPSA